MHSICNDLYRGFSVIYFNYPSIESFCISNPDNRILFEPVEMSTKAITSMFACANGTNSIWFDVDATEIQNYKTFHSVREKTYKRTWTRTRRRKRYSTQLTKNAVRIHLPLRYKLIIILFGLLVNGFNKQNNQKPMPITMKKGVDRIKLMCKVVIHHAF